MYLHGEYYKLDISLSLFYLDPYVRETLSSFKMFIWSDYDYFWKKILK